MIQRAHLQEYWYSGHTYWSTGTIGTFIGVLIQRAYLLEYWYSGHTYRSTGTCPLTFLVDTRTWPQTTCPHTCPVHTEHPHTHLHTHIIPHTMLRIVILLQYTGFFTHPMHYNSFQNQQETSVWCHSIQPELLAITLHVVLLHHTVSIPAPNASSGLGSAAPLAVEATLSRWGKMYVNVVFVIRCLYSALYELFLLLLVIIKEQFKLNVQCTVWFLVTGVRFTSPPKPKQV